MDTARSGWYFQGRAQAGEEIWSLPAVQVRLHASRTVESLIRVLNSNAGAYLTPKNKCEITQPAPDTKPDWLLDWML